MSQVTSPVILDSTGQDIVTQLAAISAALAAGNVVTGNTDTTLSGVLQGANGKVAVKPVDASPTADSTNLVSSGGTDKAIKGRVPVYGLGKNLLDNWYFVGGGSQQGGGQLPINQRGQTSYSLGYSIDRWIVNTGSTLTFASDGVHISAGSTYKQFYQFLENPTLLANRTLTLSMLITSASVLPYAIVYKDATTEIFRERIESPGLYVKTFTTDSNGVASVRLNGLSYVADYTIQAMKLELGTEQTLCHNEGTAENPVWVLNEIPDYGEELRKCQRYYFSYPIPANQAVAFPGIRGDLTAGTNVGVQLDLPVVMAKSPTIDGVAHSIRGNGSNWNTGLSVTSTPIGMYANHIAVEVIASNASFPALTNGYAVLFSKLNLSAEL